MPARTNEELLDLLVIGLTWIQHGTRRQLRDVLVGRSGNGVFQTLEQLGMVDRRQYADMSLRPNESLRTYAAQRTQPVFQLGSRPPRDELIIAYNVSDKWLIAIANKPVFYAGAIFTGKGYRLVATMSGQRHALSVAGQYAPLSMQDFLAQWHVYRRGTPRPP